MTFDRRELNRILELYGRMVAAGEWRDYAIDFLKDRAVFSVFRRSSEVPIYRIEKNPKLARRQGAYSVVSATGLIVDAVPSSTACCACSTSLAVAGGRTSRRWFPDVRRDRVSCVVAPGPSARCISTLSSQRPNL